MCGITGFSLAPDSDLDVEVTARVLLASIAERGADAAGMAWMDASGIHVRKQPGGASRFLEQLTIPDGLRTLLLHVRDHTKGRPSLEANNHPIRHGRIVGVHNGKILNDERIFAELGRHRAEPEMTVDSEAIFALLDAAELGDDRAQAHALSRLRGPLATGWFDAGRSGEIFLARGYARPLWTAQVIDDHGAPTGDLLWASTLEAIQIAEELIGIRLRPRPVRPGTILTVADGAITQLRGFRADPTADWLPNPVASPDERTAALAQLTLRPAI